MSNSVFPDLPGLDIEVERNGPEYDTTIHTASSGKEYATSWVSTPLYSYKLRFNVLRSDVMAPAPNQALSEINVLIDFVNTHRGRWDSFLYTDPLDGLQRRVRFEDDGLKIIRVADGMWRCELGLVSKR